jgi:trans-aconitate methyltransferase
MTADESQQWDPDRYARNARFVSELGSPVVELLKPRPGERILDLGCGDGALTLQLQEAGCKVTGVDASSAMVASTRALGLEARVMPGAALTFDAEFDAVFSNAALHWMLQPVDVIAGVWRALKPGGRFVAEFGGHGNVATLAAALGAALARRGHAIASPWYFPEPAAYQQLLEQQGFVVTRLEHFPRPTPLPGTLRDWLETFAGHYTEVLTADAREQLFTELEDELRESLTDGDGHWFVDYVRLRFAAVKPEH